LIEDTLAKSKGYDATMKRAVKEAHRMGIQIDNGVER
jgi:hypothetical protein